MSDRVAFVVPGFTFSTKLERYQRVGDIFKEHGAEIEYINPDWSKLLDENIERVSDEISQRLEKYDKPEIYFFGHSWGAVCCLTAAPEFNPEALFLAGLSPEFSEELKTSPPGHRKVRNFLERVIRVLYRIPGFSKDPPSLNDISSRYSGEIYLFYGKREYNTWMSWLWGLNRNITRRRREIFNNAEEIVVPEAGHFMKSHNYLDALAEKIEEELRV